MTAEIIVKHVIIFTVSLVLHDPRAVIILNL